MPYRFLDEVAIADVAFEATASRLEGLFDTSARALTDVMVDRKTVRPRVNRTFTLTGEGTDRLLYDFLTRVIILKDVDSMLFKEFRTRIGPGASTLECRMKGEKINRKRHRLRIDVKAVTMHLFGVRREGGRWAATVVLDI